MIKVVVSEDSWYPVYTLDRSISPLEDTIEIPDAIYDRYVRILREFNDMQDEIRQFQSEQSKDQYARHTSYNEIRALRFKD